VIYSFLKWFLFRLSAEKAHHLTTSLFNILIDIPVIGSIIKRLFAFEHKELERTLWGLKFKNPVGLAAGFDKDGKHIKSMSALGFGFIKASPISFGRR